MLGRFSVGVNVRAVLVCLLASSLISCDEAPVTSISHENILNEKFDSVEALNAQQTYSVSEFYGFDVDFICLFKIDYACSSADENLCRIANEQWARFREFDDPKFEYILIRSMDGRELVDRFNPLGGHWGFSFNQSTPACVYELDRAQIVVDSVQLGGAKQYLISLVPTDRGPAGETPNKAD
jgi:hypothetical protein